jgi:aspartate kinase
MIPTIPGGQSMIVMKFGGSSVADAERIRHVAGIVKELMVRKPTLVLSAMGDTTDHLLDAGSAALKGKVSVDLVESLHRKAAAELGLPSEVVEADILPLLEEL